MKPVYRRITAIVGAGLFFDLFDVFLAGVLSAVLTTSYHFPKQMLPLLLGSSFLGMFLGATGMGVIADHVGRRRAFLLNLGIYSFFTLMGAFSINGTMLIVTRFLAGIGIGAELPLSDAYLSELLPESIRGKLTAWAYTLGFIGVPMTALLARVLVPLAPFGIAGWRWLFVIGSLGSLIVWTTRRFLPESPRWLMMHGRLSDAKAIALQLGWAEGLSDVHPISHSGAYDRPSRYRALIQGYYRSRSLMLLIFHIAQPIGYFGFGTVVPLVLTAKGFSVLTSLTYTALSSVGYPLGSALSMFVIEKLDRRWLIVWSAASMALLGFGMAYSQVPVAIVSFGLLYTAASNVFSNAYHVFQGEIYPTSIRASAVGAAYGVSRLSSAAMPFVLIPVLHRYGAEAAFAMIATAMLIVVIVIATMAPRTTGQTLEQINPV